MRLTTGSLGRVLRNGSFRNFWLGFTLSGTGDMMTKTALVWYVLQTTHSSVAVGLLLLAYAGPVSVGGLIAGYLLDRFDRRLVMLGDNVVRGIVVLSVPIAAATGHLMLWHVYLVAAIYGFLYMISLAGTPSIIPSLVEDDQLNAANSLENLGFTVSGVAGPALAGVLIGAVSAPNILILDCVSYFLFAVALATMRLRPEPTPAETADGQSYRIADAVRLLVGNSVLLSTTLMFMSFNAGEGFLQVWLPVHATELTPSHGATVYGVLLAVLAVGETVGALVGGSLSGPMSEGRMICLAQVLAGLSLAVALFGNTVWSIVPALFLLGFFSAPLTAWAQTLRMRIIPPELRGRSFALLRTLMQASSPAFSAIGGALLPVVGVPAMIGLSAGLAGVPGLVGTRVRGLVAVTTPAPATGPTEPPSMVDSGDEAEP